LAWQDRWPQSTHSAFCCPKGGGWPPMQSFTETKSGGRSNAAMKRAKDLADYVAELHADGVTSLRAIADSLNENDIETPSGGAWGPSSVRNLVGRLEEIRR